LPHKGYHFFCELQVKNGRRGMLKVQAEKRRPCFDKDFGIIAVIQVGWQDAGAAR
jgi:hypothetical protein